MRVRIVIETEDSNDNDVEVTRSRQNYTLARDNWVSDLYDLIDETVNQAKNAFKDVK